MREGVRRGEGIPVQANDVRGPDHNPSCCICIVRWFRCPDRQTENNCVLDAEFIAGLFPQPLAIFPFRLLHLLLEHNTRCSG